MTADTIPTMVATIALFRQIITTAVNAGGGVYDRGAATAVVSSPLEVSISAMEPSYDMSGSHPLTLHPRVEGFLVALAQRTHHDAILESHARSRIVADALQALGDDVKSVAWGVAKFLVVDDWNKLTDSKAPTWERALAGVSLLANFVGPEGKAVELAAKPLLEHAVEKLAEGGGREAMKKLLEHGGVEGMATVARQLRSEAGLMSKEIAEDVGKLLESPALKPILEKVKEVGQSLVETGKFLENVVTKSSLVPSLRALGGELEKSPAILAAAAFGQRNTINQLLGYESLPSLPTLVGGARQLGSDLVHAGSETLDVGSRGLHAVGHEFEKLGKGAVELEQRAQHAIGEQAAKLIEKWTPDMSFTQFESLIGHIRGGGAVPARDASADRSHEQHRGPER